MATKTGTIRIYSRCSYEFENGDGEKHAVPFGYIGTAPAWIADTELFKLAVKSGKIDELTTKEMEQQALNGETAYANLLKGLKAQAKALNISGYTKMDADALQEAIAKAVEALQQGGDDGKKKDEAGGTPDGGGAPANVNPT